MITRRAKLLGTSAFFTGLILVCGAFSDAAADDSVYDSRRIDVSHARTVGTVQQTRPPKRANLVKRQSMVARAAQGRAIAEVPPKPLDGSLVRGNVRQVGFLDGGCDTGYGPVCGCEAAVCDCGEAACGIEPTCEIPVGCGCDIGHECTCGVEAGCGLEIVQGGCDIGGPTCGIAPCGDVVCDGGCDSFVTTPAGCPIFLPFLRVNWQRFDFFVGTQGFTGPTNYASVNANNANNANNRLGSSSFGFYQGFNEGRPLHRWFGNDYAAQFGLRATQSNLSGSDFSTETRHQIFLTAGIFRRVDYGFQYGLAVDYLNEDWYYQADLTQLRGEFSWNTNHVLTYGFQYMIGVDSDTSATSVRVNGNVVQSNINTTVNDQYRFFLRRNIKGCGTYTGFAGWTDNDDGLIGSLFDIALSNRMLLNTGATYLIPNEGDTAGGPQQETWNISLGVTWRPGGASGCSRHCRPMFDVADNGTMMVDRR